MTSALRFLLVVAAVADASSAYADSAMSESRVRKAVHEYARCVVKHRADLASDAIVSNAPNFIIVKRYALLIDSDCLSGVENAEITIQFGSDSFRYALADALVGARFSKGGPASFADRLPLAHVPFPDHIAFDKDLLKTKGATQRKEMEEGYKGAVSAAWMSRYGECIVRQQPEKARLWLLTPPDVPEEMSRISDISQSFAACSPAEAGTLRFSRMVMRGAVAINYYRLAMATPQPIAEKAN